MLCIGFTVIYACFRSHLQKPSGGPGLHLLVPQPSVGEVGQGPQGPEGLCSGQFRVVPPGGRPRIGGILQNPIGSTGEGE